MRSAAHDADAAEAPQRILGVLGGMGWASTLEAYRQLNRAAEAAAGPGNGAELLIRSVDFSRIHALQAADDWQTAGRVLAAEAARLEAGGAGAVLLCTNTMHRVADAITAAVGIPLIHIADATAAAIRDAGGRRVGLLGTRFTMEGAFYTDRLRAHGLDIVTPSPTDRQLVHDIIYDELVAEVVTEASRTTYMEIIERLIGEGLDGVIAGCTEIELLVRSGDVAVPWYPTTTLHTGAGAVWLASGRLPETPPDY